MKEIIAVAVLVLVGCTVGAVLSDGAPKTEDEPIRPASALATLALIAAVVLAGTVLA